MNRQELETKLNDKLATLKKELKKRIDGWIVSFNERDSRIIPDIVYTTLNDDNALKKVIITVGVGHRPIPPAIDSILIVADRCIKTLPF